MFVTVHAVSSPGAGETTTDVPPPDGSAMTAIQPERA
jgi:hypothetical protein